MPRKFPLSQILAIPLALTLAAGPAAAAEQPRTEPVGGPLAAQAGGDPLADLAADLDYDVETIFRFVADEIRYEPYVGILRGPLGTLQARAGNSADQALLLAALLDDSLVPYRFARGTLDEAASAALVGSITTDAAEARHIAEEDLARGLDELLSSGEAGVGSADAESAAPATQVELPSPAQAGRSLDAARLRLAQTVSMIRTALDEAGISLPRDGLTLPPAEVADHVWLQVAAGADWLDLDVTIAGSEPGAVLTAATATSDQLPDEWRHRAKFEVHAERVQGGRLVTDPVLEYEAYVDEIAGDPIVFGHVTPSSVERFGVALLDVLGDGRLEYRPTLDIGGVSLIADQALVFGRANLDGSEGLLEGVDLFEDTSSPREQTALPDGEATAEWLTVTLVAPGSAPVVARRTVFDRVPAQARFDDLATVDAVGDIELHDVDGSGTTDFLPMLGLEAFAIATAPTSVADILTRLPDEELGTAALAYHGLRDALAAATGIEAGVRTFIDGPNVVSFSLGAGEPGQAASITFGVDIWHRNHGMLPLSGSSLTPAESEVVAGVMSQVAERAAIESLAETSDLDHRAIGLGAVFDAAASDEVPMRVLRGTLSEPLPYDAAVTALIEEAVAAGDIVIVPATPVIIDERERVGWWRVDPLTGTTIDVFEDGAGTESAEYEIQLGQTVRYYRCNGPLSQYVIALVTLQRFFGQSIAALDQGVFDKFVRPRAPGRTNCWTFTVVG